MKRFLYLIIAVIVTMSVTGCETGDFDIYALTTEPAYGVNSDFEYMTLGDEVTITKYIGADTEVVIPRQIDGHTVVGIGKGAFRNVSCLTGVTIPDSVTSLGVGAFSGTGLTGVIIPDNVTCIEFGTFSSCNSLTSVTIPDSVTSIVDWAFRFCPSLTDITIPDSVTSIGRGAFYGCSGLTGITIPAGVTKIYDRTFGFCSSLESVYFKGSAPDVSSLAFHDTADSLTIYYKHGAEGWTTPEWNGYPSQTY